MLLVLLACTRRIWRCGRNLHCEDVIRMDGLTMEADMMVESETGLQLMGELSANEIPNSEILGDAPTGAPNAAVVQETGKAKRNRGGGQSSSSGENKKSRGTPQEVTAEGRASSADADLQKRILDVSGVLLKLTGFTYGVAEWGPCAACFALCSLYISMIL